MTLTTVLAHLRFQYYRHGWPGALGLALLGIVLAVQTLAVPALQAQTAALRATRGNKAQAAKVLGISRAALYEKIAVLGVSATVG